MDIVSHKVRGIGQDFPELIGTHLAWSLKDPARQVQYNAIEKEISYIPHGKVDPQKVKLGHFSDREDCSILDEEESSMIDASDVELNMMLAAKRSRTQTRAQKIFIQVVNTTCGQLFVDFPNGLRQSEFDFALKEFQPEMTDCHVLLQEHLKWRQGKNREKVDEVFAPMYEPFGGMMSDFSSATYQERGGIRVFGNSEMDYTEWAEVNVGAPAYIFSVHSESGWYTYIYTGLYVHCIGREKFRGIAFSHDEVIYSIDPVPVLKLRDENRVVVSLNWQKYPIPEGNVLHRVVCRTRGGDHVVVGSSYSGMEGSWASKCTLSQLQELYAEGKLCPAETGQLDQVVRLQTQLAELEAKIDEIQSLRVSPPYAFVPDVDVGVDFRSGSTLDQGLKLHYFRYAEGPDSWGISAEGTLVMTCPAKEIKTGRVKFMVVGGAVRFCLLRTNVPVHKLTLAGFLTTEVVQLEKMKEGYVSCYLPWSYRVGPKEMSDHIGGLRFSIERVFLGQHVALSNVCLPLINLPRLYVKRHDVYESIGVSFLV